MSYECPKCGTGATIVNSNATGCISCGAPFADKCPNCLKEGFIETEQVCYLCDYDANNDPNNFDTQDITNGDYLNPDPIQEYSTEDETWVDVEQYNNNIIGGVYGPT